MSPTATTADTAMQRCPAEPYAAAAIWSAARSRSASGNTTAWFFAPPSACTRLPASDAVRCTCRATGVDPTNDTAATSGWVHRASTAVLSPCTTFSTPSGRPASAYSSAMRLLADGSRSLGFSTNALPQAIATGCIHSGTITGKLNGVIPAHTPSGCRNVNVSMPLDTWSEYRPASRLGMPQANSTTSRPRSTSPRASSTVFPCSAVTSRASSSSCLTSSSRNANITRARFVSDASRHSPNALPAACTAASTSTCPASATSAWCSPVAGSKTGAVRAGSPDEA
jgi:hypothetical protein